MTLRWIAWLGLSLAVGCCTTTPPKDEPAHAEPVHADHAEPDHAEGKPGHAKGEHGGHGDHATVHRRFDDARRAERMFEQPERDAWQQPGRVLELLALKPTDKVADVGSATGYFPVRFARAVPEGVVYGVDIEPVLVNYLNLRARKEGLTNLVSLVCAPDDPRLPEPVDVVFVCDTYHHISDRVAYFRRLAEDLRPGGRLVIVDYREGDFPVGPRDDHKIPPEQVERELLAAGWRLAQSETLKYQYFLAFKRP
jgi:SAM-dependent methyltransferase